jgi:hypothetical protein
MELTKNQGPQIVQYFSKSKNSWISLEEMNPSHLINVVRSMLLKENVNVKFRSKHASGKFWDEAILTENLTNMTESNSTESGYM